MQSVVCPNCGEENPARFRLCGYCGTPLQQALPPSELRKTVTILFSDLKGSTALGEMVDPEALHEIKNRYFEAMAAVLAQHGGKIEKYIGDAIMAVFGLPRVREDDALRAVRAALGMQQALHRINVDLERAYGITLAARMGVNTGEVVATADPNADQRLADGDAVNVAARLEQASPPMEVLIGEITYALVRDQVEVEAVAPLALKGKAEPVPAYRLLSVRGLSERPASGTEFPIVGRDEELAVIARAFGEAESAGGARLVTVVGDPGVGKSRLIAEAVAAVRARARVVHGRCLPYGDGITFWPIVEIVREAAEIDEADTPDEARAKIARLLSPTAADRDGIVERIASATGLTAASFPVSELFWAIRKLLEGLAGPRPLVVIVDDIHSAETTFLDLLDHLVESADAPILLLCSARHELIERDAEWGLGEGAIRIVLRPLSAADTEAMIDRLLGEAGLDPAVRGRVAQAAEGNPLFVEQMVGMLVDRGLVRRDGERWMSDADLAELSIPPTIQALLAARLDHLSREERAVIEPASVIGLVFFEPALEEMVPAGIRPAVPAQLGELDRKQFVHPADPDADGDEEVYRFHHLLIRDAAYNSLLKRARAQLHEKFVVWAERVNRERDRETEFEEILGYHLEQAFRYRQDLGPIDEEGRAIAARGAGKLANAGRRALARGDMPAAANLLRRATALLGDDDPVRIELLPDLGEALLELGEFDAASGVVADAIAASVRVGDPRLEARARVCRLFIEGYAAGDREGEPSDPIAEAHRAIEVFDRAGDQAGLAQAWRIIMLTYGTNGNLPEAAAAGDRVVKHARRAGDRRIVASTAAGYATVALIGPSPADEVIVRCEELLAEVEGDRRASAVIRGVLAVLYAMQGSFDRARELYRGGQVMLNELGPSVTASSTSTESSRVELLAGDLAAAEAELRRDYDALEAVAERYFRSTIAGLLARTLCLEGRFDDAARYSVVTREIAAPDDIASQVLWRSVDAQLLAQRGNPDAAIALGEEAVTMARETASPAFLADAHVDLAEVYAAAGRPESAGPPLREALDLYAAKGDLVSAERVRRRLEDLAPASV